MSLTRQHILKVIKTLLVRGTSFTVADIAQAAGCHINTAYRAIADLKRAGKLKVYPGQGSLPATYEVIDDDS